MLAGIDQPTFGLLARKLDGLWRDATSATPSRDTPSRDSLWDTAVLACAHLKEHAGSLHNEELYAELKILTFVPATKVIFLMREENTSSTLFLHQAAF